MTICNSESYKFTGIDITGIIVGRT